jgi:hypothetical protein
MIINRMRYFLGENGGAVLCSRRTGVLAPGPLYCVGIESNAHDRSPVRFTGAVALGVRSRPLTVVTVGKMNEKLMLISPQTTVKTRVVLPQAQVVAKLMAYGF